MLKKIYKKLKEITINNEAFYSSIQEIDGYSIESFSYRLANNEMFKVDFAKEMRGIAFIYGKEIVEPKLFTLGFHKFFNYGEGETLSEIKGKEIESIQDKVDGSLVMFGKLPCGKIIAKSKTSITSFVSDFANRFIKNDKKLYDFIEKSLENGNFPIFEYVGLENRIVVSYEKSELIFLGMRDSSGKYFSSDKLLKIRENHISHISMSKIKKDISFKEVLVKQKTDEGYEGFIINFTDGYKLKIKLQTYVLKHRAKDDIGNIKNLINICLDEQTDDLRTLFLSDEIILKYISETEKKVFKYYNHVVSETEKLISENSDLIEKFQNAETEEKSREYRKQIAMKNNKSKYFSLIMKKLSGNEIDYKEFVRGSI